MKVCRGSRHIFIVACRRIGFSASVCQNRSAIQGSREAPLCGTVTDEGSPLSGLNRGLHFCNSAACGGSGLHCANRGSAALIGVRFAPRYQNHNLGWHEVPQAVEHPRETEKPPGTPSGRRLRLETIQSPVERLFPPSGGVSRGSVRVGGETFLLPSYGFSFGYKRKGVSFAPLTEARRKIVGHKTRAQ